MPASLGADRNYYQRSSTKAGPPFARAPGLLRLPPLQPIRRGTLELEVTLAAELRNMRVLVVDDDLDTLEVMRVILESHGAESAVATTAAEGLAALETFRPEVILSDIGLPDEDGYEFMRKVRALPSDQGGQTPAVAASAHVYTSDRERAFNAGFHAFLAKPINARGLVESVKALVERARARLERRCVGRRARQAPLAVAQERRMFERRQACTGA
jgi:CheY-like chemotaxis protein